MISRIAISHCSKTKIIMILRTSFSDSFQHTFLKILMKIYFHEQKIFEAFSWHMLTQIFETTMLVFDKLFSKRFNFTSLQRANFFIMRKLFYAIALQSNIYSIFYKKQIFFYSSILVWKWFSEIVFSKSFWNLTSIVFNYFSHRLVSREAYQFEIKSLTNIVHV